MMRLLTGCWGKRKSVHEIRKIRKKTTGFRYFHRTEVIRVFFQTETATIKQFGKSERQHDGLGSFS